MKFSDITHTINEAWGLLDTVTESSSDNSSLMRRALASELEQERGHRKMGATFTHGRAGYRGSAELAARLFVLRFTLETRIPVPRTWKEIQRYRPAVPMAYALGEVVRDAVKVSGSPYRQQSAKRLRKMAASILAIDYAKDIAV